MVDLIDLGMGISDDISSRKSCRAQGSLSYVHANILYRPDRIDSRAWRKLSGASKYLINRVDDHVVDAYTTLEVGL